MLPRQEGGAPFLSAGEASSRSAYYGVSAFAFQGTNAHVLMLAEAGAAGGGVGGGGGQVRRGWVGNLLKMEYFARGFWVALNPD